MPSSPAKLRPAIPRYECRGSARVRARVRVAQEKGCRWPSCEMQLYMGRTGAAQPHLYSRVHHTMSIPTRAVQGPFCQASDELVLRRHDVPGRAACTCNGAITGGNHIRNTICIHSAASSGKHLHTHSATRSTACSRSCGTECRGRRHWQVAEVAAASKNARCISMAKSLLSKLGYVHILVRI